MSDAPEGDPAPPAAPIPPAANPDTPAANVPPVVEGEGSNQPAKPADAPEGAPETYADFTLPENYVLDDARKAALIEYGKANNLSQAKAQALVDKHIEMMESGRAAERDARVTAWTQQSKAEFGDRFDTFATDAKAGLAHMMKTRPKTLESFDAEAWGSHPDALAAFAEIGRLTRGSRVEGMGGETTQHSARDAGSVLYDHPSSQPAK